MLNNILSFLSNDSSSSSNIRHSSQDAIKALLDLKVEHEAQLIRLKKESEEKERIANEMLAEKKLKVDTANAIIGLQSQIAEMKEQLVASKEKVNSVAADLRQTDKEIFQFIQDNKVK